MANEKVLNTRILLKYDSYTDWYNNNPTLKQGEVAVCAIETSESAADTRVEGSQPPQILFKVGDGKTRFRLLPWASAIAADVYDWAKAETKPMYQADEIDGLDAYISGQIEDTNTTYRITTTSTKGMYKLQKHEKTQVEDHWQDVGNPFGVDKGALDTAIEGKLGKDEKAKDSAKLNGQSASYYTNYANLTDAPAFTPYSEAGAPEGGALDVGTLTANSIVLGQSNITGVFLGITDKAADSAKLNGKVASYYAKAEDLTNGLNGKLGSTAQAVDSAKLEGKTKAQVISEARTGYATTTYVDNKVAGSVQYLGLATSVASLSTTVGKGDFYRANFDDNAKDVSKGDLLIAAKDNPSATINDTEGYSIVKSSDDYKGTVTSVSGDNCITITGSANTTPVVNHVVPSGATAGAHGSSASRTYIKTVTTDKFGHVTGVTTGSESLDTWRTINVNGASFKSGLTTTGPVNFKAGSNVTLSTLDDDITITAKDTVYTHPEGTAPSKSLGFYKFSTDEKSHIASTTAVVKKDITDLLGLVPTANTGTVTKVSGGNGLTGEVTTSGSLHVGQGKGITVSTDAVAVTDYDNLLTGNGGTLKDEVGNIIVFNCGDSNF